MCDVLPRKYAPRYTPAPVARRKFCKRIKFPLDKRRARWYNGTRTGRKTTPRLKSQSSVLRLDVGKRRGFSFILGVIPLYNILPQNFIPVKPPLAGVYIPCVFFGNTRREDVLWGSRARTKANQVINYARQVSRYSPAPSPLIFRFRLRLPFFANILLHKSNYVTRNSIFNIIKEILSGGKSSSTLQNALQAPVRAFLFCRVFLPGFPFMRLSGSHGSKNKPVGTNRK